jgi:pyruvate formate lyase activating enzyme
MKNGGPSNRRKPGEAGSGRAVIFDIQRFSLHDGPGIRTTIFFKGCPLRCAWCQNPESRSRRPEMAFYADRCRQCFTCRAVCPEGAILEGPDRRVDYNRCTACGACAAACPADALRLIGREWDVEPLVIEIMKDRDYFADSGGGVTLSGGEPLMHPGFVLPLLQRFHEEKINRAIETCGMFRMPDMKPLLPHVSLIYYDLKQMDAKKHRSYTGADNRLILANFRSLSKLHRNLQARIPVVPGFNDDEKNIRATACFLKGTGHSSIHCLPYHNLGEAKIPRLNTTQKLLGLPALTGDAMARIKQLFRKEGINAVIYE